MTYIIIVALLIVMLLSRTRLWPFCRPLRREETRVEGLRRLLK